MSILDSLLQLLVGFLIFILPYPVFIVGFFVYFFNPTNRFKLGTLLIASGAIAVCFWFTLLEVYANTFGTYSAIILNDINSTKLPLVIGALSIFLGVFSIIGRKRVKPYGRDFRAT
jgi:hypothetical protein